MKFNPSVVLWGRGFRFFSKRNEDALVMFLKKPSIKSLYFESDNFILTEKAVQNLKTTARIDHHWYLAIRESFLRNHAEILKEEYCFVELENKFQQILNSEYPKARFWHFYYLEKLMK